MRHRLWLCLLFGVVGCRANGSGGPASSESPAVTEQVVRPSDDDAAGKAAPARPGDVVVGGAAFNIVVDEDPPIEKTRIAQWVERSATMVSDYYGGTFPVPDLRVEITHGSRRGVGFGQHWGGKRLRIRVGETTTETQLENDWVLVHEMLHACFPDLPDEHRWMQEGLSTYLEPIVRARAGNLTAEDVWGKWTRNMALGQPRSGDRGLMNTRTWARTYWGGALFWLMIDFELRKRTNNEQSLRTALRGIVERGGNARADWTPAKVVEVGDQVTKTTVFSDLFAELALAPGDVALGQLWRELGVVAKGGKAHLDDTAPLAHIRRAMTE